MYNYPFCDGCKREVGSTSMEETPIYVLEENAVVYLGQRKGEGEGHVNVNPIILHVIKYSHKVPVHAKLIG